MLINWNNALIAIFFVYGLAFYSMGLALWVESGRASKLRFARSMRLLAAFGILHGIHEWMDMFDCTCNSLFDFELPSWFFWIRLILLITSFVALLAFGEHMLYRNQSQQVHWDVVWWSLLFYAISAILIQWVFNLNDHNWRIGLDVLARYLLAVPGALLASLALWRQRKVFLNGKLDDFVIWLDWAIVAILLYGVVGQLFPANSQVFPANLLNSSTFLVLFGFPIQLFRAVLSCVIAISMIQVLRVLEVENRENLRTIERKQRKLEQQGKRELEELNKELLVAKAETEHLLEEVRKSDAQRGDMLKHITSAQESERQRIARELHDDIGQVLTGLAMGLRGLSNVVEHKPELSAERLILLESTATTAITDLRHLINDLRPPQLDDMGLAAALHSMVERINERTTPPCIQLHIKGQAIAMSTEIETTLYRVAQEAITNAMKYAAASCITITLDYSDGIALIIADNGKGFDVEKALQPQQDRTAWGLYGIMERARLISGIVAIESSLNQGTSIRIQVQESDTKRSSR